MSDLIAESDARVEAGGVRVIDGSPHWIGVDGNCDRCGQPEPPEGSHCPAHIDGTLCVCGHGRADHFRESGHCMFSTESETFACSCSEYRPAVIDGEVAQTMVHTEKAD